MSKRLMIMLAICGSLATLQALRLSRTRKRDFPTPVFSEFDWYRIGAASEKIRRTEDQLLLWADGDPRSDNAEWFDITGSPLDPAEFQYGIGKDRIVAIDDPYFVTADDPKLRAAGLVSKTKVLGYVLNDEAKAYPVSMMSNHELVNDWIGGKPVTVGW